MRASRDSENQSPPSRERAFKITLADLWASVPNLRLDGYDVAHHQEDIVTDSSSFERDIVIAESPAALDAVAADALIDLARQSIQERDRFTVALSGGRTPRGLHRELLVESRRRDVDWTKVAFFWGDERTVPPDDDESNFRMAKETLLKPLGIQKEQVHRFHTEIADWTECAEAYEQRLKVVFKASPPAFPVFDLILLGMGDDGHTASLFPFTEALREKRRWVVANLVPQLQTTRLTMTAPCINAARNVWFVVAGQGKATRLAQVLNGPSDPERLPSQLIRPTDGRLRWFVDEAAMSQL